jgi:hypothetical protein
MRASPRRGDRASWLIGLVDGILLGYVSVVFGPIGLTAFLLLAFISFAIFRSLPLLSGMLTGAGGTWAFLMIRQAILICNEPGRSTADPCPSPGLAAYALAGGVVLFTGIALGVAARRRRLA